jgi:uncharacterized protein YndB with AHSA1/START domain
MVRWLRALGRLSPSEEEYAMERSQNPPKVKVGMLIRRPAREVFEAIRSPDMLTRFWLSSASGPLELGKRVHWEFMVEGASTETFVKVLEKDKRILVEWSDGTTVDWIFEPRPDGTTVLRVENAGFTGTPDQIVATAMEATHGFTIVLCDLKVLLETNTSPNLVRDTARIIQEAQSTAA